MCSFVTAYWAFATSLDLKSVVSTCMSLRFKCHKSCMCKSQSHMNHSDRLQVVGFCRHSCVLSFATAVFGNCCLLRRIQACRICRNYNSESKQYNIFTSDRSKRWKLSLDIEDDVWAYGQALSIRQGAEANRIWCLIHSTWTGMSNLTCIAHEVCNRW